MEIPKYIARAIKNEIDDIEAASHILTKTINLHETSSIIIPYSCGITWTSVMINLPAYEANLVEISIRTSSTNICIMKIKPGEWHHFRWPIPSVNSIDPLTVIINSSKTVSNIINVKVLGYDNLLPKEMYYIMFDENAVATIVIRNTGTTDLRTTELNDKPKGYYLFNLGEHIPSIEDYEIYPTSVYLDKYDEGLLSDESE